MWVTSLEHVNRQVKKNDVDNKSELGMEACSVKAALREATWLEFAPGGNAGQIECYEKYLPPSCFFFFFHNQMVN